MRKTEAMRLHNEDEVILPSANKTHPSVRSEKAIRYWPMCLMKIQSQR